MDNKDIIKNITQYLANIPDIVFAYIFGSFVEKEKYEDIDIAIFLASGEIDSMDYLNLKRELTDIAGVEVDIAVLNEASPLLKREVIKNGVLIWERNKDSRVRFIVNSVFEYEDMKRYYEMSYESFIQKIKESWGQT